MDFKNKNNLSPTFPPGQRPLQGRASPAHLHTFSLSHFLIFSPAHLPTCKGFSLLELLAVAAILALAAAVATPIFLDKTDQTCFQRTVETMAEIEKAILGVTSDRVRGDVRFAGYVQDMGEIPKLFYVTKKGKIVKVKEDDRISDILQDCSYPPQPKGLWTNDPKGTPDNENDDLFLNKAYILGTWDGEPRPIETMRVGWRGPYLKPPLNEILEDGWGNPFVFENNKGDFVVTSLGADNQKKGEDFDKDIVHTIKKLDYTGSVSGYVSPQTVFCSIEEMEGAWSGGADNWSPPPPGYGLHEVNVRIYYAPPTSEEDYKLVTDCIGYMETTAKPDGYFHLDSIPIGTQRILLVVQKTHASQSAASFGMGYKLAVEPGTMWLGTLGAVP